MEFTREQIFKTMNYFGHKIFDTRFKYDLNIIGIRTNDKTPDEFNDIITISYAGFMKSGWCHFQFPATTDPGLFYLNNPMNVKGTAILKPGQYRGAFKIGKHQGSYYALCQHKPVTVYRDNNKDDALDYKNEETGMFGINIHRASPKSAPGKIGRFSAGCQVFLDPLHFDFFMKLVNKSTTYFGDTFTYTLLTENEIIEANS